MNTGNKLAPDALLLKGLIHSEIGEVAAIAEISQGPTDPDEFAFMLCGENEIGIGKHALDSRQIIGRPANAGSIKDSRHIRGIKRVVLTVFDYKYQGFKADKRTVLRQSNTFSQSFLIGVAHCLR